MTHFDEDHGDAPELERSARLEMMYRIVSAVSHDFNNVLATASMYSELLLQDPAVEGATAEDVREILEAARRGAALTAFLAVLKDSRGASMEPAKVSVQLAHLQKILGRLLPDGVRIEVDAPAGDPEVRLDRVRLQQAIFAVVWSVAETLTDSGGVVRVGVVPDERSVTVEIRGLVADASPAEGAGGDTSAPAEDSVIMETRTVVESFGGALEIDGGDDAGRAYRLVIPRSVAETPPDGGAANPSDTRVVVVGDPGLERLLAGHRFHTTSVATPDEVVGASASADAIVGSASRAMFRATSRVRSEGDRSLVLLLGTAVDVELPPELERDPRVRLVRAPVSGGRLADLIRAGRGTAG